MKYIFVFDFDGVICNSTKECFVTSKNTWFRLNGSNNFKTSLDDFHADEYKNFVPIRPLVKGAGEYYLVMRYLSQNNNENLSNDEYKNLSLKWQNKFQEFKMLFYKERIRLREINREDWINLHTPYLKVIDLIKKINKKNHLYIATLKDSLSVSILLDSYGINLDKSKIFDQSNIKSKTEALKKIQDIENIDKKNIIFIDDNIDHLIDPMENGYNAYHSEWSEEHFSNAKKKERHRIASISIEKLEEFMVHK